MKEKNIQIPLKLFNDIIDFLQFLDLSNHDESSIIIYEHILDSLIIKSAKLKIRDSYSRAVYAITESERINAKKKYFENKSYLNNFINKL
jgi:hypothetical protein